MSSQFSVTDQARRWMSRGGEKTVVWLPHSSWKKKKAYLCSAVDLRLSVWKPLGTPSALHLSILPPVHSSLHRRLPGSYAYLLIMLQGFSLTGMPYGEAGWQHSQVKLHTDGLYRWLFPSEAQMLSYFSPDLGSWLFFFVLRWTPGTVWTPTQWAEMQHTHCAKSIRVHYTEENKYC